MQRRSLISFFIVTYLASFHSHAQEPTNSKEKNPRNEFVLNGNFESTEKLSDWEKYTRGHGNIFIDKNTSKNQEQGKSLCLWNEDSYSKSIASQTVSINQKKPRAIVLKAYSRPNPDIQDTNLVKVFYSLMAERIIYDDNTINSSVHYVSYDSGIPDWQFGSYVIIPEKPIKSVALRCQWSKMKGKGFFDSVKFGYFPYMPNDYSLNIQESGCALKTSLINPSPLKSFEVKIIAKSWNGKSEKELGASPALLIKPEESIPVDLTFKHPEPNVKMIFLDIIDLKTGEIYFRIKSAYHGAEKINGNMLYEKSGMQIAEISPGIRIYPQNTFNGSSTDAINIFAAKGEFESIQLGIFTPKKKTLNISFSDFSNSNGKCLNMENSSVSSIDFVKVKYTTSGYMPDAYPDKLLPLINGKINLDRGASALWLTFYIPRDAQSGKYSGNIIINNGVPIKIPVEISVYNFAMPTKRNFNIHPVLSRSDFLKHMPELYKNGALSNILYKNLQEHFCDFIDAWCSASIKINDGKINISDLPNIDKNLKELNNYKFNWVRMNLPFFGNAGGKDKEWHGCKIPSPEFENLLTEYSRHLTGLLKKYCPDKKLYYKTYDEPKDIKHLKYLCDLTRKAVPDVKIFSTARLNKKNEYEELKDLIDIFCPHIIYLNKNMQENIDKISNDKTKLLSLYHNHLLLLDYPRINARMLPWITRNYKADSALLWCINAWRYLDASQPGVYYQYTEGILIYPGKTGILNSVRWELIREGVEDFEYLHILAQILPALKKYPALYLKGLHLMKCADKMVSNWQTFSKDYKSIQGLRLMIGDFIQETSAKPEINKFLNP